MDRLEFAKQSVHKEGHNYINPSAIIDPTAKIGQDGFGFARDTIGTLVKVNHAGGVFIGAHTEIRSYVTIDRAVHEDAVTIIGQGNKIDHHCHIAHNVKIGKWNTFANGCVIEGSCVVGDYNTFGTNVIIQKKIKVGSNCTFGSGTVIVKDVPDGSVMVGNPARLL